MFKFVSAGALVAAASAAEWSVLGANVDGMVLGVGAIDATQHLVAAGSNSEGAQVLLGDASTGNYTMVPSDAGMIYMDIGVGSSGNSVVGGLWSTESGNSDGFAKTETGQGITQSIVAFGDNSFALTGTFKLQNGIAVSTDGGESFDVVSVPTELPLRYGAFPTDSTWYVTAGMWPETETTEGFPITSRVHHNNGAPSMNFKPVGDDEGWSLGVYKTTDAGATWSTVIEQTGSDATQYPNGIDCADEDTCVFVAEGDVGASIFAINGDDVQEIYTDTDEGASLIAAAMVGDSIFAAGGAGGTQASMEGRVWHSTDGGNTFDKDAVEKVYIMGIDFADEEHGFAAAITALNTGDVLYYA